jgi:hypothetical protein
MRHVALRCSGTAVLRLQTELHDSQGTTIVVLSKRHASRSAELARHQLQRAAKHTQAQHQTLVSKSTADELTLRIASKKQKKTALFSPFDSARGPTPLKNALKPSPSASTLRAAPSSVGLLLAVHIMRVLTTSSGVVAAAAAAPAKPPMKRSSSVLGWRSLASERWVRRSVS